MAKTKATASQLDFTNVKDGGGSFTKRHQKPGDYPGKITKVADAKSKGDGVSMWLYTIEVNGATYPFYCKHQENQLWKIRNLFVAAGISVPKKRVKLDPNQVVGKVIGVTLEDDEYEGKMQSVVQGTFPASELSGDLPAEDDDDDEGDAPLAAASDDDDEKPKKGKKDKGGKDKGGKGKDSELDELDVGDI